jgi:hypothetical protein
MSTMASTKYSNVDFAGLRDKEGWIPVFEGDFDGFSAKVNQLGSYVSAQAQAIYPDFKKSIGSTGTYIIGFYLDQKKSRYVVSLAKKLDDFTLVWSCWQSEEARREHEIDLDGAACLKKLADLAVGERAGVALKFSEQEDKAFMWKASSVHPLQVLENAYQRIVRKAGKEPDADPVKAQSEKLAEYFIQSDAPPVLSDSLPPEAPDRAQLAAVRMNHLIDTFYLFRLLVRYQVEAGEAISEDLRVDLSTNLTKLLHNGDRAKMGWLSIWLTRKMGELGAKINALNTDGRRVIFFLKGGRALNYFLGTPEKGENDWDTQVVIDPSLPAEKWYEYFSRVHDLLLTTLQTFKSEFTPLVEANAGPFAEYLKDKVGPDASEDEEVDENEASDVISRGRHASCKAELIDIGIPRRDSASGLEEWTRLTERGALITSTDGVIYPHREYYLNEYLMMIRDTFLPKGDVRKAPKRITRFGMLLARDNHEGPSAVETERLKALPKSLEGIDKIQVKWRRELFRMMMSQFVEAYNLLQDGELASLFDEQSLTLIANPPNLPEELAAVLDDQQKEIARDVGVAHALSALMKEHWESRSEFFATQREFFLPLLRKLSQLANPALGQNAQFAVAGSYAARLHADHLSVAPDGLEPIRRILVKLQCPSGQSEADTLNAVREEFTKAATGTGKLRVGDIADKKNRSLVLYWHEKVKIGKFTYAPLVMKIRGAAQTGAQLPVLASIEGLPVLDLRYLVADYRKKTSKIDERGSRRTLDSATAVVSEMLSRFDFESDDV